MIMMTAENSSFQADLVVVGGGLAGLTAAALVARAGRSVTVLEQSSRLGGRAATQVRRGIHWNLGPHALYCHGQAIRLLRDLGVAFSGRFPSPGRGLLVHGKDFYLLPSGIRSLLGSSWLTLRERWRLLRIFTTLKQLDESRFAGVTVRDWLLQNAGAGNLSLILRALFRLGTYADDPDTMSAGAALTQLKLAMAGNVWYIDGGWQTLVDGLRDRAVQDGASVRTGCKVIAAHADADGVSVQLASGEEIRGRAAILAVDPSTAQDLLELPADSTLGRWIAACVPVRAAYLELALTRLPQPEQRFGLGLDRPMYFSVHSAAAKLAPEGVAVALAMKYLGTDTATPPAAVEQELEDFVDRIQPGWQNYVISKRFIPVTTVAQSLPRAAEQGLSGRPSVEFDAHPNVFLAGDWVGAEGQLADASAASAEAAARSVLNLLARGRAVDRSTIHVGS
jgi:phytoene dehydrogenase-like protein